MNVLRKIAKIIIIAIVTICLIASGILSIVSSTILDQEYITQKLEETNFYTETHKLVKSNFENYIYQSGLEENVLEEICTEEKVKQDINIIISNIYTGTKTKIDTTEIEQKLNSNIDKLGIKNSKNEKTIEQFVECISKEYTDTIMHTEYESKINEQYKKIINIIDKTYNIVATVLVIAVIVLIILNIKKLSKVSQELGIAVLASGIFNLICCSIIQSNVNIAGIKIFNDIFSETIVKIIQDVIEKVISLGIGMIVISVVLISIYNAILINTKNENQRQESK